VPDHVTFHADAATGNCTAGTWLTWSGQGADDEAKRDNVKAVFTMLLAAKLSQTTVNLFGNNANCAVTFIHLQ